MTLLMPTKPKTHVFIVVGEITSAVAVLLVLEPLPFVTFSISKGSNAIALATPFKVFALVGFTIAIQRIALTMRLSASHFALVEASVHRVTRAYGYLLCRSA